MAKSLPIPPELASGVVLKKGDRRVRGVVYRITDVSWFIRWEPEPGMVLEHSFCISVGKARGHSAYKGEKYEWVIEYTDRKPVPYHYQGSAITGGTINQIVPVLWTEADENALQTSTGPEDSRAEPDSSTPDESPAVDENENDVHGRHLPSDTIHSGQTTPDLSAELVTPPASEEPDPFAYDPATTTISFLSQLTDDHHFTIERECFVSPPDADGVRIVTLHPHFRDPFTVPLVLRWSSLHDLGGGPGWIDRNLPESLFSVANDLSREVSAHLSAPTFLRWECQKCVERQDDNTSDHYVRMLSGTCSERMGPLRFKRVEEKMLTPEQAQRRAIRKRQGDATSWADMVAKLRSTANILLNVNGHPATIHRLIALQLRELKRKKPRTDVLAAIEKRFQGFRAAETRLLFILQSYTDSELDRLVLKVETRQIEQALQDLADSPKGMVSLSEPVAIERWLKTARDQAVTPQQKEPDASAIIETMIANVLSGKPTGIDPETAPYTLILTRRQADALWKDPDWIGVFRDKGRGPDIVAEIRRDPTTGIATLASADQDIPSYILRAAMYLTEHTKHYPVPYVAEASITTAHTLRIDGQRIPGCTDMWALRVLALWTDDQEVYKSCVSRLCELYKGDRETSCWSPYWPREVDMQLFLAHIGPLDGQSGSCVGMFTKASSRHIGCSFGPMWGKPDLAPIARPPGMQQWDDRLQTLETLQAWIGSIERTDVVNDVLERENQDRSRPEVIAAIEDHLLQLLRKPLWGHVLYERDGKYHWYMAAPDCFTATQRLEASHDIHATFSSSFDNVVETSAVHALVWAEIDTFDHRGLRRQPANETATCHLCAESSELDIETRFDLELKVFGPHRDKSGVWCPGEGQVLGADIDQKLLEKMKRHLSSLEWRLDFAHSEALYLLDLFLPEPIVQPEQWQAFPLRKAWHAIKRNPCPYCQKLLSEGEQQPYYDAGSEHVAHQSCVEAAIAAQEAEPAPAPAPEHTFDADCPICPFGCVSEPTPEEPAEPFDDRALAQQMVDLAELAMDAFAGDTDAAAELSARAEPAQTLITCPWCVRENTPLRGDVIGPHVDWSDTPCPMEGWVLLEAEEVAQGRTKLLEKPFDHVGCPACLRFVKLGKKTGGLVLLEHRKEDGGKWVKCRIGSGQTPKQVFDVMADERRERAEQTRRYTLSPEEYHAWLKGHSPRQYQWYDRLLTDGSALYDGDAWLAERLALLEASEGISQTFALCIGCRSVTTRGVADVTYLNKHHTTPGVRPCPCAGMALSEMLRWATSRLREVDKQLERLGDKEMDDKRQLLENHLLDERATLEQDGDRSVCPDMKIPGAPLPGDCPG